MPDVRRRIFYGLHLLRDLRLRIEYRIDVFCRSGIDPDDAEFVRFLRGAGDIANPDRDDAMMAYWLVSRRTPGPPMPEALESAYYRFRGRRRRDDRRARAWRRLILQWARLREQEMAGKSDDSDEMMETGAAGVRISMPSAEEIPRFTARPTRRRIRRRLPALTALSIVVVVLAVPWLSSGPERAGSGMAHRESPLAIPQLERGAQSLVEEALRARYIDVMHRVQSAPITDLQDGLDFEQALLQGARLDVLRAIERHAQVGRVPPRLHLLLGKLSLLTGFEVEGRRALARAANHGGEAGRQARELLAMLPR